MSLASKTMLAALLFTLACVSTTSAEAVRVQLKSGQILVGKVHERSTPNTLWLEFRGASTTVLRPVYRGKIASIEMTQHSSGKHFTVAGESNAQTAQRLIADDQEEVVVQIAAR